MGRFFQFLFFLFFLCSCSFIKNKKSAPIFSLDLLELKTKNIFKDSIYVVPQFPKLEPFNWLNIISPLVNELIQFSRIKKNDYVLIDSVENKTNINVNSKKIVSLLVNIFKEKEMFNLISEQNIENARSLLGFSEKDELVTKNKSIGLGRFLKSDYLIYLIILNKEFKKEIEMQLIETISGEILWSGSNYFE